MINTFMSDLSVCNLIAGIPYSPSRKLDLYLVDPPGRPLVACLHGGGFVSGGRDDERCGQAAALLNEAGFNCASISYSLASPEDRFGVWPRNLFDVADAVTWLHQQAERYGYSCEPFGMLGFSAGCCLANLYIQGGKRIFKHLGYDTEVFFPSALVGFYGPYDFPSRQVGRKSSDNDLNRDHSPSFWVRRRNSPAPPVLHIQGDRDTIVYPDQHQRFQRDYEDLGYSFTAIEARGFGHSFAPRDLNDAGESLDLPPRSVAFFTRHLVDGGN